MSALGDRLNAEFASRRAVNPRYSLRAFAAWLVVDHSTLSQVLRGRRAAPADLVRGAATRLGLGPEESAFLLAESADDPADLAARNARARWLGEARALLSGPAHWRILELMRSSDWHPDMRWVAGRIGAGVDEVNDAMTRLLRLGLVEVGVDGTWRDVSGVAVLDARSVSELALSRLRTS